MKIKKQTIAEVKLNENLFYVEQTSDNEFELKVGNVVQAIANNEEFFTTYINKNNEKLAQIEVNEDYQVIFKEQELPIFVKLENAENYLNYQKELENNKIKRIASVFFNTYVYLPLVLQYRKDVLEKKEQAKKDLLTVLSIPEFNCFKKEDFNIKLFIEEYEKLYSNDQYNKIDNLPAYIKLAIKESSEKNNSTVDIALRLNYCYLNKEYNSSSEYVILNYLNEGSLSEKFNKIFFETYKENNYKL